MLSAKCVQLFFCRLDVPATVCGWEEQPGFWPRGLQRIPGEVNALLLREYIYHFRRLKGVGPHFCGSYHFNTYRDPGFHFNAVPDPDPASRQSDGNPQPLVYRPLPGSILNL